MQQSQLSFLTFPTSCSREGKTRKKIDPRTLESAVNDLLKGILIVNEAARMCGLSISAVNRPYQACLTLGLNENSLIILATVEKIL